MARAKWLSSEEKESIMEMRAGGMTAAQIASKMERGVKSIQRVLSAKEEKNVPANVTAMPVSVSLPANATRPTETVAPTSHGSYPLLANVMEMRAGGMTAAQIVSNMETAIQLTQPALLSLVAPEAGTPAAPVCQQELVPTFAPRSYSVPVPVASEQGPVAVSLKIQTPPKSAKRPQGPRATVKKSPPKTKANKSQQSRAATQVPPPQQSHFESQDRSSPYQEPQFAMPDTGYHSFQASAQRPITTPGVSTTSTPVFQHSPVFSGCSTEMQVQPELQYNVPVARSGHSANGSSTHANVEMSSVNTQDPAPGPVGARSPQRTVESMVNIIPDDDSEDDEEGKMQTRDEAKTQQPPPRQVCVRRPPRINDGYPASIPSNVDSPLVNAAPTSQASLSSDQVRPPTHQSPTTAPIEMLRSFEAELESSQAQTLTPPTSQIEPEPCVVKKRKIDASDTVKPRGDALNDAMALLAKVVEDSLASSKAGLSEKRLALLFQRFQADVQLLQLEQPCNAGPTSWEL